MITSMQNPQVKMWKKLHKRKYRKQMQKFLIEGFHLIEEAYKSNWTIETILICEGETIPELANSLQVELLDEKVFKEISQTESSQGIVAVVNMKTEHLQTEGNMLLIDAVQDPGNLGTMIRTADAVGFSDVILGKGTVDHFNEKVIRATQGSIFHVNIMEANLREHITRLKAAHYTVWASALTNATSLEEAVFKGKTALVVGNEGSGISNDIVRMADQLVKIPIHGRAESLNVSVAAGILMYQINSK